MYFILNVFHSESECICAGKGLFRKFRPEKRLGMRGEGILNSRFRVALFGVALFGIALFGVWNLGHCSFQGSFHTEFFFNS